VSEIRKGELGVSRFVAQNKVFLDRIVTHALELVSSGTKLEMIMYRRRYRPTPTSDVGIKFEPPELGCSDDFFIHQNAQRDVVELPNQLSKNTYQAKLASKVVSQHVRLSFYESTYNDTIHPLQFVLLCLKPVPQLLHLLVPLGAPVEHKTERFSGHSAKEGWNCLTR